MKNKTTILSDLGNVLLNFDHGIAFKKIAAHLNPLTAMYIWAKKDAFMKEMRKEFDLLETGKMNLEQMFSRLKGKVGGNMPFDSFKEAWCDIFSVCPETISLIKNLSEKYNVFILSNTNAAHYDFIRSKFPELDFVKEWITSYSIGVLKPEQEFYQIAVEKLKVMPEQCVFIDDNLGNVEAAKTFGIDAIHHQNAEKTTEELKNYNIGL